MPRPVQNPPNPWSSAEVDWEGEPPPATLEVFEEEARSALSKNDSPDVGFRFSVNPYRGCYHGCAYCYARPSHEYLGWGAGTDFERKIVIKRNIAKLLRREFERPSWEGETVVFSGVTDCYQPLEASYRLTRACLEVCLAFQNPVAIITKGAVIQRDAELLAELHQKARVRVMLSIPFATDEMGRRFEPYASPISKRFETLRRLHAVGVPVGVSLSPMIPGVNDADIPAILGRAREAGADVCFMTMLRLPSSVRDVFDVRLEEVLPDRANKVRNAVKEMRRGRWNETGFGARMRGQGERWAATHALFERYRVKYGYGEADERTVFESTFRRPTSQLALFE
ncbi:MAG: radical SAM protein [Polyangiales bacterium]